MPIKNTNKKIVLGKV